MLNRLKLTVLRDQLSMPVEISPEVPVENSSLRCCGALS
jgi:hypothetical protein